MRFAVRRPGRFMLVLLLLTLCAFVLRLYRLDSVPAGLFYDEAYEGLDAYSLTGKPFWQWPLFFTAINGREPLFVYLVHAAQSFWGPTTLAVRMVSATAGALLTPALIWLAWELAPFLGVDNRRRFSLWAGAASLALLWPQTISRLGQRISLFGLLEVLALAALWRAWAERVSEKEDSPHTTRHARHTMFWWILAGVLVGLSFYTYLAVRLLPLVLAPVAAILWLRHRQAVWARRWGLLAALGAALVAAAPLSIYFIQHPEHFNMRTGQVNILAQGGFQALLENVEAILGMAFVRGDFNLRLNFPNRPVLDFFTLLPFTIGLLVSLRWLLRPTYLFLLSGLGVMLLPTLLSEEAPNFGRSFGAFPFVVLLVVLGLERLVSWFAQRLPATRMPLVTAAWVGLIAATTLMARVYFVDWVNHPDSFAAWDTGYTAVALAIRQISEEPDSVARIYAGPGIAENPTVEYLLADIDPSFYPRRFDGNICLRVATDQAADYYVLTQLTQRGASLLSSYLPDGSGQTIVWDEQGREWVLRIEQPSGGTVHFPEMITQPVALSDGLQLRGYWLSQERLAAGETFYTRLFWDVTGTPSRNYTAFVHLLHRTDDNQWENLAGADRPPGDGSCPTAEWSKGEVIVDELQFTVPIDLPQGEIYLATGFYDPATGERLLVPGSPERMVLIGPLEK